MAGRYQVTCDLFQIPYGDNQILYAPLLGFACLANRSAAKLLADLERLAPEELSAEDRGVLDYLETQGVLNGQPGSLPAMATPTEYAPTQVTLFPTNQCNLRCRYCYAAAGDEPARIMDWQVAVSAIDIVIKNVRATGANTVSLGFHGGGEPLHPWALIQAIVLHAEEQCRREGLKLAVTAATNGVLAEEQLEWIAAHFHSLSVSFDGLPHVQDYHRPLHDGSGSYRFVERTLRFLDQVGFAYGIRSTITSYNIALMRECAEFILQSFRPKSLQFEPLFVCGRCQTSPDLDLDLQHFGAAFLECERICRARGLPLTYSGCRLHSLTSSFCGVSRDNFSVTPEGFITACYEITSRADPRSEVFFIGRIDQEGRLQVDEGKRDYLRSLDVSHLTYCTDCYAKWHCAGDCLSKLGHGDYGGERGHERCRLNRRLIRDSLASLLLREGAASPEPSQQEPESPQKIRHRPQPGSGEAGEGKGGDHSA